MSADPGYPSLQTHEIEPLSRRYGMKVWQSYLENKTSGAMRMYWVYGPDQKDITIIGLEPHPDARKDVEKTKKLAKKFVRYQEGAELYSIGLTKFQELAKEAKAVYKIDKVALVNCEIFEKYLETFRIA